MSHTLDSVAHPLSAPSRSPWGWLALGVLGTSTAVLAALNVVQWRAQQDAAAPVAASLSAPALTAPATGAVAPVPAPLGASTASSAPAASSTAAPVAPRPASATAQRSSVSSAQKPALARVSTRDNATKTVASADPMTEPADDSAAWQRERERSAPASTAQPPAPPAAAARTVCHQCGTVEAITPVTQEGPASGIGAVAGGLLGGLLGNQVGGGEGKTLATMAGVVGGAWAGNTVEKRMKPQTSYQVRVRMDDGSLRSIEQSSPSVGVGSRVQVQGSVLSPVRD
ncbi:MAG: glycine zipper 2TM domain-containing protein [Rhodoferax sp.]